MGWQPAPLRGPLTRSRIPRRPCAWHGSYVSLFVEHLLCDSTIMRLGENLPVSSGVNRKGITGRVQTEHRSEPYFPDTGQEELEVNKSHVLGGKLQADFTYLTCMTCSGDLR